MQKLCLAFAAVAACGGLAVGQVVNGGFEDPGTGFRSVAPGQSWGGWTCAGPNDIEFVHATPTGHLPGLEFSAYEGAYWIDLVGVGAPSAIYQDVPTAAGQAYEVSFALAGNVWSGAQIMNMDVVWNGAVAGSFSHNTAGRSGSDMGWTVYSVTVIGTGGSDRLMFRGMSGSAAAGPALDAVTMAPVPTPGVMAVAGIAAAGLLRRRR